MKLLEEKITNNLPSNIQKIIEDSVEALWKEKILGKCQALISQELNEAKAEIAEMKTELNRLIEKTDHMLGSIAYVADEYDDFHGKITDSHNIVQQNVKRLCSLKEEIQQIKYKQNSTASQLDELEQYGRRVNLEIHGIPSKPNENTNQLVKKVASLVNMRLEDSHISVSHRLPGCLHTNETKRKAPNKPIEYAPIIVCFSNQDKRNEFYQKRKLIKPLSDSSKDCFEGIGLIRIRENLTPFRKNLYNQAKKAKVELNYKFLWTSNGRILLRQNSASKVLHVSSVDDLAKLEYRSPIDHPWGEKKASIIGLICIIKMDCYPMTNAYTLFSYFTYD